MTGTRNGASRALPAKQARPRVVLVRLAQAALPWKRLALALVLFLVLLAPTPGSKPVAAWMIESLRALTNSTGQPSTAAPYSGLPTR